MSTESSPAYRTRPLDADTWSDFATLVEANNGIWGGCWCMGFHPEGVGTGRTASQNRESKHDHVLRGTVHQVLVYDGEECVGWCQYGSPTELPNIKNAKAYDKELGEAPDWRIGCIFTGKGHRREGAARAAVAAALTAIEQAGGGLVEAYPEQVEGREPQRGAYFHTGPEDLGGFNRSSQHLDDGGVWWRVRGSRGRSDLWVRGGSGLRIGRCGPQCGRRVGLSRRVLCSGSSGG